MAHDTGDGPVTDIPAENRILDAAQDELAATERTLNAHIRKCKSPGCADCQSLARHRSRCERQVALLVSEPAEMEPLF